MPIVKREITVTVAYTAGLTFTQENVLAILSGSDVLAEYVIGEEQPLNAGTRGRKRNTQAKQEKAKPVAEKKAA